MLSKNKWMTAIMIAAVGAAVSSASAQLALNELWENPPMSGADELFEYIEIYGPANYDLTGYSICMLKGIAGNAAGTEIDEAYSLDGLSTDANGLLFIYNGDSSGDSGLSLFSDPTITLNPCPSGNPCWDDNANASKTNRRFTNGIVFPVAHINIGDTAGKLGNDDSSTYFIVRRRPNHGLIANGSSFYAPGYAWHKDTRMDIDANSRLDFGTFPVGSAIMQPVQIVDELAWSNNSGYEYNIPGRGELSNKLGDTPGFNPDGASRLRYLSAHPHLADNTLADESWIYGEHIGGLPTDANYPVYKHLLDGSEETFGAPTNPATSQRYSSQGFRMTPGSFNDAPAGSALANFAYSLQPGSGNGEQFRWVRGDFNFDGVVNCDDRAMIVQAATEGWNLDEAATFVDNNNTSDNTADDITYTGFARQVENFNGVLAMIRMNLADGSTGEWTSAQIVDIIPGSPTNGKVIGWGGIVTAGDLALFDSEFPGVCVVACAADFNGVNGVTVQDIFDFLTAWLAGSPSANFNGVNGVTVQDIFDFLTAWLAGC